MKWSKLNKPNKLNKQNKQQVQPSESSLSSPPELYAHNPRTAKIYNRRANWLRSLCLLLLLSLLWGLAGPLVNEVKASPTVNSNPGGEFPFTVKDDTVYTTPEGYYCGTFSSINLPLKLQHGAAKDSYKLLGAYLEVSANSETYPFVVNQLRYPNEGEIVESADKEWWNLSFGSFQVRPDVNDGYYSLNFTVFYEDATKTVNTQQLSYLAKFHAKPKDPTEKEKQRFLLGTAELPVLQGVYGQSMPLQFGIVNRGFDVADIISVTPVISGDSAAYPFEISKTDYTLAVDKQLWPVGAGSVPSESTGTLVMCNFGELVLRQKLSSGYKEIKFLVKFKYGSQDIQEATLSSYVDVVGNPEEDSKKDEEKGPMPRLICQGFTTEPARVMGGQPFKLHLKLKNTAQHTPVQNIRIVLAAPTTDEGQAFITADGSSSIFVNRIEADSEHILDVEMVASVKMPQKSYIINVRMEYSDLKNTPITSDEAITLALYQLARVDTGKIEITPQDASVGQDVNLTFPIYNKGKAKLYNVSIKVPEGQAIKAGETYIGNMDPGATSQADLMVKTVQAASPEQKQKLQLCFEDENGVSECKDVELQLSIAAAGGGMDGPAPGESFPEDLMPGAEGAEQGALPKWAWGLIAGGAFLVLLILLFVGLKRRKRKKQALEDEAFFNDFQR